MLVHDVSGRLVKRSHNEDARALDGRLSPGKLESMQRKGSKGKGEGGALTRRAKISGWGSEDRAAKRVSWSSMLAPAKAKAGFVEAGGVGSGEHIGREF